MYIKKLTPEEALESIKLRMKYDVSKTLNENKFLVNEQYTQEEERLFNIANMYSKVDGQGKIKFPGDFHDGWDWSKYVSKYGVTQDEINAAKQKTETPPKTSVTAPTKKVAVIAIPSELKDVEGVKKFQDWLDKNYEGWHDKYKVLNGNVSRGYGKFGPRTNKWWKLEGPEFIGPVKPTTQAPDTTNVQTQTSPNIDTTPPKAEIPKPVKGFQNFAQTQFGANAPQTNAQTATDTPATQETKRVANQDTEF